MYIHKCTYINIMRYKCMITSRASRLSCQVRRHTNVCKYIIHSLIHTHIHTYIHTCMHAYIHTYICRGVCQPTPQSTIHGVGIFWRKDPLVPTLPSIVNKNKKITRLVVGCGCLHHIRSQEEMKETESKKASERGALRERERERRKRER